MYSMRLVKGEGQSVTLPVCSYYEVKTVTNETQAAKLGAEIGISVELCPSGQIVQLPRDGEELFVMNERGGTVDRFRWPPRPREKEFRR